MNDIDRQAIIAEIATLTDPPRLEEGEMTTMMLVKWSQGRGFPMTRKQAASQLEKGLEDGLLISRKVKHDGRRVNAYSKAVPVTDSVTNGE